MVASIALCLSTFTLLLGNGSLVATEVIRAGGQLNETNTVASDGTLSDDDRDLFGREVIRTVYIGNVISLENTRAPRLVTRNQVVTVKYQRNGLEIILSGRAMEDGSAGEEVSVMNPKTKRLMNGEIMAQGWVLVR